MKFNRRSSVYFFQAIIVPYNNPVKTPHDAHVTTGEIESEILSKLSKNRKVSTPMMDRKRLNIIAINIIPIPPQINLALLFLFIFFQICVQQKLNPPIHLPK